MQTNPATAPDLATPIADYFASRTSAAGALSRCFTDDAVVLDEHREHRGRSAIAAWDAAANATYEFATEVLRAETDAARTTVFARVTGNFPGGTVDLRFHFTLAGKLISRLEIAP